MTRAELDRAFDDFYTTKAGGHRSRSLDRAPAGPRPGRPLRVETEPAPARGRSSSCRPRAAPLREGDTDDRSCLWWTMCPRWPSSTPTTSGASAATRSTVAPTAGRRSSGSAGEPVDCVILDLEMPGMDGFEVLRALERRGIEVPVIVYTGTGNYDRCIQAVRLGAYGFIDKAEPIERVVQEIELARRAAPAAARRSARSGAGWTARARSSATAPRCGGCATRSPGWRRSRARVLILGESGIGQGAGRPRAPPARPAARRRRSSPSTARRCPSTWSRASCSATSAARSPAPSATRQGRVRGRGARHALPRRDRRAAAAGAGQAAARAGGAPGHPARRQPADRRSTPGSWPPPTATSRPRWRRAGSARTCTTGSTCIRSRCRRCASGARDVPALAEQFLRGHLRALRHAAQAALGRRARSARWPTTGAATTSASCGTSSSGW